MAAISAAWPATGNPDDSSSEMPVSPADRGLLTYLTAIRRTPFLSPEEERRLARSLRDTGDTEAARTLVLSHLRYVAKVARGYLGYGLPQMDLIQEGTVGLMKAVKRFDPEKGVRLASFAIHWIKAEIQEYALRNWRMVRIATTKGQRKLFFNLRSLRKTERQLGPREVHRIADALDVKPEEVQEMASRFDGREMQFEPSFEDEANGRLGQAPEAFLGDENSDPAKQLESSEHDSLLGVRLSAALAELDSRSRAIVQARWLVEGRKRTLHDLAAEFNVSAERIRQIESEALAMMRRRIGPDAAPLS